MRSPLSRCLSPPSWDQCLGFCLLGQLLGASLSQTSRTPAWCRLLPGPGSPHARGADGWVNSQLSVSHLGKPGSSSLGSTPLGPTTPTGFQDCHLSGVYGRGAERPGPRLKIARLGITSQAGKGR